MKKYKKVCFKEKDNDIYMNLLTSIENEFTDLIKVLYNLNKSNYEKNDITSAIITALSKHFINICANNKIDQNTFMQILNEMGKFYPKLIHEYEK